MLNPPTTICPRCGTPNPRAASECARCNAALSPTGYSRYASSTPAAASAVSGSNGPVLDVRRLRQAQRTRRAVGWAVFVLLFALAFVLVGGLGRVIEERPIADYRVPDLPTTPPSPTFTPNLPATATAVQHATETAVAAPTRTSEAFATETQLAILVPTQTAEADATATAEAGIRVRAVLTRTFVMTTTKGTISGLLYGADAPEAVSGLEAAQGNLAEATLIPEALNGTAISVELPGTIEFTKPKSMVNNSPFARGSVLLADSATPNKVDGDSLYLLKQEGLQDGSYYKIGQITEGLDVLDSLTETDRLSDLQIAVEGEQPPAEYAGSTKLTLVTQRGTLRILLFKDAAPFLPSLLRQQATALTEARFTAHADKEVELLLPSLEGPILFGPNTEYLPDTNTLLMPRNLEDQPTSNHLLLYRLTLYNDEFDRLRRDYVVVGIVIEGIDVLGTIDTGDRITEVGVSGEGILPLPTAVPATATVSVPQPTDYRLTLNSKQGQIKARLYYELYPELIGDLAAVHSSGQGSPVVSADFYFWGQQGVDFLVSDPVTLAEKPQRGSIAVGGANGRLDLADIFFVKSNDFPPASFPAAAQHLVIGEITEGLDVLDRLTTADEVTIEVEAVYDVPEPSLTPIGGQP